MHLSVPLITKQCSKIVRAQKILVESTKYTVMKLFEEVGF